MRRTNWRQAARQRRLARERREAIWHAILIVLICGTVAVMYVTAAALNQLSGWGL